MFIDNLGETRILESPIFSKIEELINQLDRDLKYYLEVYWDDTNKMSIAGGLDQYIVDINQGDSLLMLMNVNGSEDSHVTIYTGQESEYPTNSVVRLQEVISAVRFFCENKVINPDRHWEKI
jgi:hypothetical protein